MKNDTVPDADKREALTAFFWWTAWAAVTRTAGRARSPTPTTGRTSRSSATRRRRTCSCGPVFSVLFLIAGIALLGWHHARHTARRRRQRCRATDPLALIRVTPSMRATAKYFWLVIALFLVPDPARRDHRALPGRRPGSLRLRARRRPAVLAHAHLAHAARGAVDRDGVARHGPVHRAGDLRT